MHDWDKNWIAVGGSEARVPSHEVFKKITSDQGMDLDDLCRWRDRHPYARIVTDVKVNRVQALFEIKETCGVAGIIPQIHDESEYVMARRLGFDSIILTLYKSWKHPNYGYKDWDSSRNLIGITFPVERIDDYDLRRLTADSGCALVHTVNESAQWKALKGRGICAIYTDRLDPESAQSVP